MAFSARDLDSLNAAQFEAATCTQGPLLVLAGAGSGKTRVLTYRIAHMIEDEGVRPWQILAITFTNKAAAEMRERLDALMDGQTRGMWICTFHALCVRLLRDHPELVGFKPNFLIYDDGDSKQLIKTILDELSVDTRQFPIPAVRGQISNAKNALIEPEQFKATADGFYLQKIATIYEMYQQRLKRANAFDFDDLLLYGYKLLAEHEDVLAIYQDRFRYISVDEYQDTNHAQYALTNLLAERYRNLMVVGDDDQSIYSWRGADIANILAFEKDYPDAHVVKLEQNYRSTGNILNAANAVVAHNSQRKPKRLFTDAGDGEPVRIYAASDDRDEGRWIASEIEKYHDDGMSYNDIAVFYRTNAQSRLLEDMMLRAGVPYKIVGGTRFFDRAEIRDVMAYLKLIVNPFDDMSALRVVNVPRRSIGSKSVQHIQWYSHTHNLSFMEAAYACIAEDGLLPAKARNGLAQFTSVVEESRHLDGDLAEIVSTIIDKIGLIAALEAEHTVEAQSRIENLQEFINVAAEFDETHDDVEETLENIAQLRKAGVISDDDADLQANVDAQASSDTQADIDAQANADSPADEPNGTYAATTELGVNKKLAAFIEWLALRSDLDALSGQTSAITLMTIHSAKGLEFPVVFVSGMEENIFPNTNIDSSGNKLEEERRLAYVALTRAMKYLTLTHASQRRMYGTTQHNPRSRFLDELPLENVKMVGVGSDGFFGTGWEKRGDRHGTYGSGRGEEMYGGRLFGASGGSSQRSLGIAPDAKRAQETFEIGDQIAHKTFGPGVVLSVKGDTLEVRFSRSGKTKKLMKGFAPIEKINS